MIRELLDRPRRLAAAVITIVAAAGAAVGSGASFTSQPIRPEVTGGPAELLHLNSRDRSAILSAADLKPGDVRTGVVTLTNRGTSLRRFVLDEQGAQNPFGPGVLRLEVVDLASGATVFSGDLGELGTRTLRPFGPGEVRSFRFRALFSRDATNADQGRTARAGFVWRATALGPGGS